MSAYQNGDMSLNACAKVCGLPKGNLKSKLKSKATHTHKWNENQRVNSHVENTGLSTTKKHAVTVLRTHSKKCTASDVHCPVYTQRKSTMEIALINPTEKQMHATHANCVARNTKWKKNCTLGGAAVEVEIISQSSVKQEKDACMCWEIGFWRRNRQWCHINPQREDTPTKSLLFAKMYPV